MKRVQQEEIIDIQVNDCERRIILTALKELRNEQIRSHKNYEFIEEIMGKVALANPIKYKTRSYEQR